MIHIFKHLFFLSVSLFYFCCCYLLVCLFVFNWHTKKNIPEICHVLCSTCQVMKIKEWHMNYSFILSTPRFSVFILFCSCFFCFFFQSITWMDKELIIRANLICWFVAYIQIWGKTLNTENQRVNWKTSQTKLAT